MDSHSKNNVRLLLQWLQNGMNRRGEGVVFLSGAGLGNNSNLPTVNDVLDITCSSLLADLSDEQYEFIFGVQPELIYSILLECANGDERCLDAWKCLSSNSWNGKYSPKPNPAHIFIAAYSYLSGVPILTMNFDTMFEDAFTLLWRKWYPANDVQPPIVVWTHQDDPRSSYRKDTVRQLYICKLHGDIARTTDRIDVTNIKTTMSGISVFLPPWVDFLRKLIEGQHLCFCGYSGRDIDFFPIFVDAAKHSEIQQTVWFIGPQDKAVSKDGSEPTLTNSRRLESNCITSWPIDILPDFAKDVFSGEPALLSVILDSIGEYCEPQESDRQDKDFL